MSAMCLPADYYIANLAHVAASLWELRQERPGDRSQWQRTFYVQKRLLLTLMELFRDCKKKENLLGKEPTAK